MFFKKRVLLLPFLLFVLSVVFTDNIFAQNFKPQIETLVNNSDVIVIGKVTETRSEWNQDKKRIYTRVTITVDQELKGGNGGKTITLTHLGGEVGEIGELYSHTPNFTREEEVLVFAKWGKDNQLRISGGNMGKYTINKNEINGKRLPGNDTLANEFIQKIKRIVKEQI